MSVRSYLSPPHPVELLIFCLPSVTSATNKNKTKQSTLMPKTELVQCAGQKLDGVSV